MAQNLESEVGNILLVSDFGFIYANVFCHSQVYMIGIYLWSDTVVLKCLVPGPSEGVKYCGGQGKNQNAPLHYKKEEEKDW